MSVATKKTNGISTAGFKVPCPHCGATEGLTLKLTDLAISCEDCSEDVTANDLNKLIEDARRLIRWLDSARSI